MYPLPAAYGPPGVETSGSRLSPARPHKHILFKTNPLRAGLMGSDNAFTSLGCGFPPVVEPRSERAQDLRLLPSRAIPLPGVSGRPRIGAQPVHSEASEVRSGLSRRGRLSHHLLGSDASGSRPHNRLSMNKLPEPGMGSDNAFAPETPLMLIPRGRAAALLIRGTHTWLPIALASNRL